MSLVLHLCFSIANIPFLRPISTHNSYCIPTGQFFKILQIFSLHLFSLCPFTFEQALEGDMVRSRRICNICKELSNNNNSQPSMTMWCKLCKFHYHETCLTDYDVKDSLNLVGQEKFVKGICGPCRRWQYFKKRPVSSLFLPRYDMTELDKREEFLDFFHRHSNPFGVAYSKFPKDAQFFGSKTSVPMSSAVDSKFFINGSYDCVKWTRTEGKLFLQQIDKKYVDTHSSTFDLILTHGHRSTMDSTTDQINNDNNEETMEKTENSQHLISGEMTIGELVQEMAKSTDGHTQFPYKSDQPGHAVFESFDFGPFDMNSLDEPMSRYMSKDSPTIPGCTTPVLIVASKGSPSAIHGEDNNFNAINIHLAGGLKIWTILDPTEENIGRFIHGVHRECGKLADCGYDFRQKCYFVPLDVLIKWNVNFSLILQRPGELIATSALAFHQIFNWDWNVTVARNFIAADWQTHRSSFICPEKSDLPTDGDHIRLHGQDLNRFIPGNVYGEWRRRKEQKVQKRKLKESFRSEKTRRLDPISCSSHSSGHSDILNTTARTPSCTDQLFQERKNIFEESLAGERISVGEREEEGKLQKMELKDENPSTGKTLIVHGLKLGRLTPRNYWMNYRLVKGCLGHFGKFVDCRMHKKFVFLHYQSEKCAHEAYSRICGAGFLKVERAKELNIVWENGNGLHFDKR